MTNDKLWENLYWAPELTRPDRFAIVLNSIIRKDSSDSEYFIYDQQAAKDAMKDELTQRNILQADEMRHNLSGTDSSLHDIDRFDLRQHNIHHFRSVNEQDNHTQLTHHDKLRLGKIGKQFNSQSRSSSSLNVQNYTSDDKPVFVFGSPEVGGGSNDATETRSKSSNHRAHVTAKQHKKVSDVDTVDVTRTDKHNLNLARDEQDYLNTARNNKEKYVNTQIDMNTNNFNATKMEKNAGKQHTLSRHDVVMFLRELSDHVYLEGDMIKPRPINARLIKIGNLSTNMKLFSSTVLVRMRSNVHVLPLRLPLRASLMNIHPNATWNQNGHTVAGQNSSLSFPFGLFVNDDQTIYVADSFYHRIVAWKEGETNEQVVAGGYGQGNDTRQLNGPSDVIVDKETDSLIICDRWNDRVVRWPCQNGTSGETIISNITCWGVTMDEQGSLYVSVRVKDEVRRYRRGESQGTTVAGGNGRGDHLYQLNEPLFIFVDRDHSVFVSDWGNHRVMKWIEGAKDGVVVAGGQGQGSSLSQLSHPLGVLVDQLATVYVVDRGNNRIVRWPKGAKQGNVIVGGNGEGTQGNQLNYPEGLSFDRHGHLYVADAKNSRVQRFAIEIPSN
ncbi:unnamed protein product [Didymodactylos carnosus]|uniref:NHL repeat-containing protein n=1 Tax=Didymodactylos carnosus TaxID=1234261 RepID=A0A8S2H9N6_9BILA|nr:unnamed protein product [Didymodactylos carnosus]CAF3618528.1 unnamed protein product [Didymodactylos carnosus]